MAATASSPLTDFEGAPSPPSDYQPCIQWMHKDWNKVGNYIITRELREAFLECHGFWPTLEAPELLNQVNFVKFCYYAEKEENQADEEPEGYIPIDFEENDQETWKERKMKQKIQKQYCADPVDLFFNQGKKLSEKEKRYLQAIQECNPEAIRSIFREGTADLDPNCLQGVAERTSTVSMAMENLYYSDFDRSTALECLELVCSLDDNVDTSMDHWYGPFPPLYSAVQRLDVETARILIQVGKARTSFEDSVVTNDGQWCNIKRPPYQQDEKPTALHCCVTSDGDPDLFPAHETLQGLDQDMKRMIELLLEANMDVLAKCDMGSGDCKVATALDLLTSRREEMMGELPSAFEQSCQLLRKAHAEAQGPKIPLTYVRKEDDGKQTLDPADLASILDLEVSLQQKISEFMDPVQWRLLKQTCKALTTWPKPPPPAIDYELISFMVPSDYEVFFGVAKTVPAAVDAIKHIIVSSDYLRGTDYTYVLMEFIRFDTTKHRIIPLLEFYEYCADEDSVLPEIHETGRKFLGVKEAIDFRSFPDDSPWKRLEISHSTVWCGPTRQDVVLGEDLDILLTWLEGREPTTQVDLTHLGTRKPCCPYCGRTGALMWQRCEQCDDERDMMVEIWYNPDWFPDNQNVTDSARMQAVDPNGQWAVFSQTAQFY